MNYSSRSLGLVYLCAVAIFFMGMVYLYWFSYDGEIFPILFFPVSALAIFFFIRSIHLIRAGNQNFKVSSSRKQGVQRSDGGKGKRSLILRSNFIVIPLTILLFLYGLESDVNYDILLYGLIFGVVYVVFSFGIYLIIAKAKSFGTPSVVNVTPETVQTSELSIVDRRDDGSVEYNDKELWVFVVFAVATLFMVNAALRDLSYLTS